MTILKLQNWERMMRNLWIYIFVLSLIYVLYLLRNYIRSLILAFKLSGPKALPVIGSAHIFFQENLFYGSLMKEVRTNSLLKVWVSVVPFIMITQPDDIQIVLGSMKHNTKSFVYTLFRSFLGNGLIVSKDETWKYHRRIIHSAFNSNGLEKFTKIFAKNAEEMSLRLFDKLDEDINIVKIINDIIYSTQSKSVLGLEVKTNYTEEETNMLPFKKNQQFAAYRLIRPWLLIDRIFEMTKAAKDNRKQQQDNTSMVYRILKETEKSMRQNSCDIEHEENGKRRIEWSSLLEYMIEMKDKYPQFTDKDVVDECCTFMLAGMESVSTTLAITLFLLANNKEWQDKCVDELNTIFKDNDTTFTSTQDLKEMKCLEMCIKESLRLYPSVPVISRRLNENEKLGGHIVPAGCNILICPFFTHRLPQYFPDPESFRPERFDPANSDEKMHPYAYLPFSAGLRNCIGYKFAMLEIKMIISTILRNFIMEPVEGKNVVYPKYRMTLRARGGLWVRFKARTKTT